MVVENQRRCGSRVVSETSWHSLEDLCRFQGCKNRPALFPGRMSYKWTKLALSVVYLSMLYIVLLFIRTPFYVLLVFVAMYSVFWLLWLSCQYLPSDWLERLLWGSLTMARGSSPESPGRRVLMIFLVYCIVLLCVCVVSWPCVIYFPTPVARCSQFVLKVPLKTKQKTNKLCIYWHACLLGNRKGIWHIKTIECWYVDDSLLSVVPVLITSNFIISCCNSAADLP